MWQHVCFDPVPGLLPAVSLPANLSDTWLHAAARVCEVVHVLKGFARRGPWWALCNAEG